LEYRVATQGDPSVFELEKAKILSGRFPIGVLKQNFIDNILLLFKMGGDTAFP